jgi:hypothetical protein
MPLSILDEEDGRIAVSSPYHPNFPARARSLGGIWDTARRVWVFDAADLDRVKSLCREIYGTDDSSLLPNPPLPGLDPGIAGEGRVGGSVPKRYGARQE